MSDAGTAPLAPIWVARINYELGVPPNTGSSSDPERPLFKYLGQLGEIPAKDAAKALMEDGVESVQLFSLAPMMTLRRVTRMEWGN